jgi:long-chain fatty acid transport protein
MIPGPIFGLVPQLCPIACALIAREVFTLLKRSTIAAGILLLTLTGQAFAGGFNIYEMGTRATALGGAFTATADDASAIFYNPAGLAWQDSAWEVSGNLSLIMPMFKYTRATGTEVLYSGDPASETENAVFPPVGLYGSYKMKDGRWAFGLGFFTPFGLGVKWDKPETFAGRPLATDSEIQGYYISPMVTFAVNEQLALSVGLHAVKTHLSLKRFVTLPLGQNVGEFQLQGNSEWAVGAAAGAMYRPNEKLSLGVNYKGGVKNAFKDQDADLTFLSGAPGISSGVSGDLKFPTMIAGAVRYDITPKFGLELDLVWFQWSVFDEVKLDFDFDAFDTVLEENYKDVVQYRAGAEYQVAEEWRAMAGFVWDNSPQPIESVSPLLPDADRQDYSFGFTWGPGEWELSAAYMLVYSDERSTVENGVGQNLDGFDGAYRSIAHIYSFGVSRDF